jgi:hypothetical protein
VAAVSALWPMVFPVRGARNRPRMSSSSKVTTALGETRLLILGAQVLFGFELESVFQGAFSQLAAVSRLMSCGGIALMAIALGLLVAPSMQHRIAERGQDTAHILTLTTTFAEAALLPFGASLGLAMYVVFDHLFGRLPAILAGTGFCLLAGVMWFGVEFAIKSRRKERPMRGKQSNDAAPLSAKIDQLLTEARLILPGAQALFGFQLVVTLTSAFEGMPAASRMAHVGSLCCVALAVILLMMPAALHRISFAGEDDLRFFRLGSAVVVAAPCRSPSGWRAIFMWRPRKHRNRRPLELDLPSVSSSRSRSCGMPCRLQSA